MNKQSSARPTGRYRPKGESRELIVLAVNRVIAREGLGNTTVEAIANEAGMSKGGVLHYFPSKKALLFGMLDFYEQNFRKRRAALLATLPQGRYSALKATILLMLEDMQASSDDVPNLAGILDDPELCARVGEIKRQTFTQVTKDVDNPGAVALVMYVMDGLWMDNRFSPMVIPVEIRKTAIEELISFIDSLEGSSTGRIDTDSPGSA